ncbi:CPBP family intramembrane glutamic endopeptidase [Thalassotalea sp. PS06]|uniref:CPBP family intramembrane glutamic endopeptidase n=1 Tax=Thalassotalea sp. PS06 TaxID=2594005 RepID=UPI00163D833A|nr:type II CAAX endopeptidase family protein [Thalassotalea sp. PS06]
MNEEFTTNADEPLMEKQTFTHQEPEDSANTQLLTKGKYVFTTFGWMLVFYVPSLILSLFVGIYAGAFLEIPDIETWIVDGDVTAMLGIGVAIVTLPVVYWAINLTPVTDKLALIGLRSSTGASQLLTWGIVTAVFIGIWWVINATIEIETPQFMVGLKETTDNIWLLFFAICIVAPIFEEIVFRGFMFGRLENTPIGKWGTLLITSLVFTLIHGQYNAIELTMVFSLALLLGYSRMKTGNLYVPTFIHMFNNTVSMVTLYMFEVV